MAFADQNCFTYDLGAVIRRLGQERDSRGRERTTAYRTRYIQALIAKAGFPAPLPLMRGDKLIDDVLPASRWPIVAVDRWFGDRDPESAAQVDLAAERKAAGDMDARAAAIAAGVRDGKVVTPGFGR